MRKSKVENRKSTPLFPFLSTLFCLLILPACSPYQLRGRVIEGSVSAVVVVDKSDPRLGEEAHGLGGASIEAVLDPQQLNREHLPPSLSQRSGEFAIPVSAAGAGLLEYDVEVLAQLPGHGAAIGTFRLPGRSNRVLVMLAPGDNRASPRQPGVLEETMQMGKPYLAE